uniref:hypothetical protein n=1 Tax=Muriicola sp. TaxID=2020856 RepID=UPI003569C367
TPYLYFGWKILIINMVCAVSRISNVTPEISYPVNDVQRNTMMSVEMDMKQGSGDIAVNTGTLKIRALLYVEYRIR